MSDLIERPNAKHFNFTIGVNEDGILYVPFREVVNNIQNLPTVEAIPIEFIEQYIYKYGLYTCAMEVISAWRAERKEE